MKDIKTYNEFVNEEFLGFSQYRGIINKINKYLETADLDSIKSSYDNFDFVIRKGEPKPDDPYGEEVWEGEDVAIRLRKDGENYTLQANGDLMKVTNYEAKKLWKFIQERRNNRAVDERKARTARIFQGIFPETKDPLRKISKYIKRQTWENLHCTRRYDTFTFNMIRHLPIEPIAAGVIFPEQEFEISINKDNFITASGIIIQSTEKQCMRLFNLLKKKEQKWKKIEADKREKERKERISNAFKNF
jgi:hypothetical protein